MTATITAIPRAHVDTVRGIACLLLVASHMIIGGADYSGQHNDLFDRAQDLLIPVRMPLFTVLSGFVYGYRPASPGRFRDFATKKARRLLVPLVFVTLLLVLMKSAFGRDPAEVSFSLLPYYLTHRFEHLWFLQALAVLFLLYAVLDTLLPTRRILTAASLCIAGSALFFAPVHDITIFSFGDALYLLPFFSLGILLNLLSARLKAHRGVLRALLLVILGAAYAVLAGAPEVERFSAAGLIIGLTAPALLLLWLPPLPVLARIGTYSFTIYLFHVFFAALANRLVADYQVLVLAGTVMGVLGPIGIETGIRAFAPWLLPLIGQRPPLRVASNPSVPAPVDAGP